MSRLDSDYNGLKYLLIHPRYECEVLRWVCLLRLYVFMSVRKYISKVTKCPNFTKFSTDVARGILVWWLIMQHARTCRQWLGLCLVELAICYVLPVFVVDVMFARYRPGDVDGKYTQYTQSDSPGAAHRRQYAYAQWWKHKGRRWRNSCPVYDCLGILLSDSLLDRVASCSLIKLTYLKPT